VPERPGGSPVPEPNGAVSPYQKTQSPRGLGVSVCWNLRGGRWSTMHLLPTGRPSEQCECFRHAPLPSMYASLRMIAQPLGRPPLRRSLDHECTDTWLRSNAPSSQPSSRCIDRAPLPLLRDDSTTLNVGLRRYGPSSSQLHSAQHTVRVHPVSLGLRACVIPSMGM
jgi:hypothetical protein